LLVLDLQMPGLGGTEVQQSLKMAGASFPIVIITAHDSPSLREECMNAGAVAYLCKPLDIRVLVRAVSQIMPSLASASVPDHPHGSTEIRYRLGRCCSAAGVGAICDPRRYLYSM
jgi:FixJ family two-component response regulator